jgi:hypothetical protein
MQQPRFNLHGTKMELRGLQGQRVLQVLQVLRVRLAQKVPMAQMVLRDLMEMDTVHSVTKLGTLAPAAELCSSSIDTTNTRTLRILK